QVRPVAAALDRQRALPRRRQAVVGIEQRANARAEPEPLETRSREDDRGITAFVELAQPRVHVTAQCLDGKRRMTLAQLRLAPQARRADDGAFGQRGE